MSGAAAQVVSLLTMVMTSTSPGLIRQTWFAGDCDYPQELVLWDTLMLEKKNGEFIKVYQDKEFSIFVMDT